MRYLILAMFVAVMGVGLMCAVTTIEVVTASNTARSEIIDCHTDTECMTHHGGDGSGY